MFTSGFILWNEFTGLSRPKKLVVIDLMAFSYPETKKAEFAQAR